MEDKFGYYKVLGVASGATAQEIKTAYRRRALETHPDKNRGRDTTREFQRVSEAYRVLSDPVSRARYDAAAQEIPPQTNSAKPDVPADPIRCSSCRKPTAQPRYVIFLQVVSLLLTTTKSGVQGIYCSRCALWKGLRASAVTWIAGWWGIPYGPIYTVEALVKNLFGGMRPADVNAKLLAYQVWWLAVHGKQVQLARSVAVEAVKLATRAKDHTLVGVMGAFLKESDDGKPVRELRDRWSLPNGSFAVQACLGALLVASMWATAEWDSITTKLAGGPEVATDPYAGRAGRGTPRFIDPDDARRESANAFLDLVPLDPPAPTQAARPRLQAKQIPANGTFDVYWSGNRYPLAPFRVKTSAGTGNYFIKLVQVSTGEPIITFFVHGGMSAEVEVPLGTYRMKYAAGPVWYGEEALFGPDTVYSQAAQLMQFSVEGDRVVGHSVELILRRDGNLRTNRIKPAEF